MPTQAETQYKISVKVKDKDLTSYVTSIKIFNSIYNCWPLIDLIFEIDNQEIIEFDIYGQELIDLIIQLTTETGDDPSKMWKFKLVYLQSPVDLAEKPERNMGEFRKDDQRRITLIRTIPYQAMNVLSTSFSKVWEEPTGMIPLDLVKKVLELRGFLSKVKIEDKDKNENMVNQLIIPPMSIKRAIDYIDDKFSVFKGPLFRYCDYGGNMLIWDLHAHYLTNIDQPKITLYKVSTGYDTKDEFQRLNELAAAGKDGKYIGYDMVETNHYSNSVIVQNGYDVSYITHPRSDLYYLMEHKMEDIVKDYGIKQDGIVKYYKDLKNRKLYVTDYVGFPSDGYSSEYSKEFATSKLAMKFRDSFSLRFVVKRNLDIKNLMKIGEVCNVEPSSDFEKWPGRNYSGSYIIANSELVFNKSRPKGGGDNYETFCFITVFRSTQSKDVEK